MAQNGFVLDSNWAVLATLAADVVSPQYRNGLVFDGVTGALSTTGLSGGLTPEQVAAVQVLGAKARLFSLGKVRMSAGSMGNSISADPLRWWELAVLASNGTLVVGKNASVPGNTTQAIVNRMHTDWPAGTSDICFHFEGTNDFGDGATPTVSYAQHSANVRTIVEYLLSIGTLPILAFPPPRDSSPAGLARMGLCAYVIARQYGLPFLFPWRQFVSTTTGAYTGSAGSIDGVHPSRDAQALAAADTWAQMAEFSFPPLLPLSQIDGAGQRTTNCLFLTDSNADGLADGVVSYGDASVVHSLSAGTGAVKGNWQVLQANGASLHVWEFSVPVTGFQAGDTLLVSMRLIVEMLAADAQCTVVFNQYVGGAEYGSNITPGSNTTALAESVVLREVAVVPGVTAANLTIATNVASARASLAQLQVYNLTGATR